MVSPRVGRAIRLGRQVLPPVLLAASAAPPTPRRVRAVAAVSLVGLWSAVYARYRKESVAATEREYDLMRTATPGAFSWHYNENVPTIEEELDIWGAYHRHRHEMRYAILADSVRRHVSTGARILDVGCGAALVAERLADRNDTYVGMDFGGHHITFAAKKFRDSGPRRITTQFVRGDGERLPFVDGSFDCVVFSEVIEHLMRPELAVWEIARVLRPGGVLVMTTNNASEMPLRSPASHLFAWLEKAVGFHHDRLISHRPWIWPEPVNLRTKRPDEPLVYLPHTWHKQAETRRMFGAAGLATFHAGSFEFPPPQSATARWLEARGALGRSVVDGIELVCQHLPLVNRLGCHVLMLARRVPSGEPAPPPGIWPGPFSGEVPRPASPTAAGSGSAPTPR